MFVQFTATDRLPVVVNATQVTFISEVEEGTRIRFGEGRSVTVIEPLPQVLDQLNRTAQLPTLEFQTHQDATAPASDSR